MEFNRVFGRYVLKKRGELFKVAHPVDALSGLVKGGLKRRSVMIPDYLRPEFDAMVEEMVTYMRERGLVQELETGATPDLDNTGE